MQKNIENVIEVIDYIEEHLSENLDLDRAAGAVHYSKYHLHRINFQTRSGAKEEEKYE